MIKKCLSICAQGLLFTAISLPLHASPTAPQQDDTVPSVSDTGAISTDSKIQEFLKKEAQNTTNDFPYRINLFTQGQIDKNKAGLRIAETANQLQADTIPKLIEKTMKTP